MLARKRLSTGLTLHLVYVAALTALLGLAGCGSTHVASGDSPAPGKITVTTSSLPTGQTGNTYAATLQAQGGTAPYKWSLSSGTLPAGLSLNSATGAISGIPTQSVANLSLSFTVIDSSTTPLSTSVALSLTITAASSGITITTQSLPNGQIGVAYSGILAATGGKSPYTWTLTGGTLPGGLILNGATGAIAGTPTTAASLIALSFKVTDSSSSALTQTATLTMTIFPAGLVITTTSLPNGQVNVSYSAALTAVGGTSPYTWSLSSGALPTGLSLNASTGAIIGTPSVTATATPLIFKVTDASSPALTQTIRLALSISPAALVITTTSLPNGEITMPYNATLAATGGTTPYTWKLTGGTLPTGLTLNPATGAITGTPTTPVTSTPVTFMVTDSAVPALTKSANLTLTITGLGTFTVSVSPVRAALTTTQPLNITATTNDPAGVTWSATGGSLVPTMSVSGTPVVYTAPLTPGTYTLTATSVSDGSDIASTTIYVTDLAGVYTYHNDLARDGANTQEYALSTSTVTTSTFGKLFSCAVDGAVYAQPLWVANLAVSGGMHNVIFVATQHDSLYAFDADATPCMQLWKVSLIDTAHGAASSSETSVPSGTSGYLVGSGSGDITPEVGVTGTPVIDPSTNTLYVVSKSVNSSGPTFYQRLHAIDVTTGNEKFGVPANITSSNVTSPGTGDGGTTDSFNARQQNQRPGLALVGGVVYVAWASHEDNNNPPYYGWVVGFNASSLAVASILNVAPNAQRGGIWMGGGAPSADVNGNLYLITGNASFNANTGGSDYGDCFLQLSAALHISSYFSPSDEVSDNANDDDFGAGGSAVVLNLTSGSPPTHLVVGGGKDGTLYLLNGDSMGGLGDSNARQYFNIGNGIFASGAFWNNHYYIAGIHGPLLSYTFNTTNNTFNTPAVGQSSTSYGFPGTTPSVSSTGASNGIVWALNNSSYCTAQSLSCAPAVLHAYSATSLATELWNSSASGKDNAGNAVKFNVPTVANGKVYVGTRGSDNSNGGIGELDVYGLKPN
jgi:hypothetical protein